MAQDCGAGAGRNSSRWDSSWYKEQCRKKKLDKKLRKLLKAHQQDTTCKVSVNILEVFANFIWMAHFK